MEAVPTASEPSFSVNAGDPREEMREARLRLWPGPNEVLGVARYGSALLVSVVTALVTAMPVWAQSGSVSGKVTGADRGGPLAGAIVSLDVRGVRVSEVRTRSDGSYRISGVPTGSYTVRVRSFGYSHRDRTCSTSTTRRLSACQIWDAFF